LLIYLATLILWAIPDLQDHALRNAVVALLLHASLFLSGLLFWSRIFDRGAGPRAVSHGSRLMMLWFAILAQILVGSATSMKTRIWYPAYRAGLADEAIGGILLWIPSSLLTLLGLIFVIHLWGRHETRLDLRRTTWSPSNSVILLYPESARSLRAMAAPKNKQMALSMLAFAAFIFAAAITTAFAYRLF
jgi:putative membrane protein